MSAKYKAIFILSLALVFLSCKEDLLVQNQQGQVVSAKIITAEKSKVDKDFSSFGVVSYNTKNDVTTQVQGVLSRILVKDGDFVTEGKVIAVMKNIQLEIQLEQSENSVKVAEAAVFMAQAALQEAEFDVENRLLDLEKMVLQIQQHQLELSDSQNKLSDSIKLFEAGGITQNALDAQKLSVKSMETDLQILVKNHEAAQLGLRDCDLFSAGYQPYCDLQERRKQLIDLNTRSHQAELESARAGLENARKSLDSLLRLNLQLQVKSPCTGIVGAHYFEQGEFVTENEKIFTIMDVSNVNAVFDIQENDITSVSVGNPIHIEIPSLKENITACISEISPLADGQTGNFTVKARMENKDMAMRPGMFLRCVVPRNNAMELPFLPETVLAHEDEEGFGTVFIVRKGLAVKRKVKIEKKADGYLWISEGIETGEKVVDKPSSFLKEGSRVQ